MIYLRRFILFYPVAMLVVVYTAWLSARFSLGHWPVPGVDHLQAMKGVFVVFGFLHSFLFFGFLPYVGVFSLLLTHAVVNSGQRMVTLRDCGISFTILVAFFLLTRFDPGHAFAWLGN